MKTCGYCGNQYDDKEPKCPQCGATLLKHTKGAESAAEEHERLKEEINRKRKNRSMILGIGAGVIVLAIVIIISSIVGFVNDPQREIAKESKELLSQAEQQVDDGEYDDALDTLNRIDTDWDDYEKVDDVRLEAVKGQLKAKLAEYEAAGNYQAIISMINENVTDINADTEVKTAYESAVQNYKAEAISSAEEYAAAGDYTSARSALTVAQNFIGDAVDISEKLKEINQKEVLEVALSYEAEGNYRDAIIYLNENSSVVSGSADLQAKLSTYTEKYRANVIGEAASEYEANGYEAAVSVLNSALRLLTNDSVLTSEKAKYEAAAPIALADFTIIDSGAGFDKEESEITDVYENTYYGKNYKMWCCHGGGSPRNDGETYAVFYLGGEYTNLKGTYFMCDVSWNSAWRKVTNRLTIYADDLLVFDSGAISFDTKATTFDVDIGNAEKITIRCRCSDLNSTLALVDLYVYKDVSK